MQEPSHRLLWRALLKVGGPHADLATPARPSRGVEASEANSAEIAWQYMQPRSIANRMMCRPRVPYARSRLALCGNQQVIFVNTPSSRGCYEDNIASTAWGAQYLISTQVRRRRGRLRESGGRRPALDRGSALRR